MKKLIAIFLLSMAIGCGADEANVASEQFIEDFGSQLLTFQWGCNAKVTVTKYTDNYTLFENGNLLRPLYGIDRSVIQDVGIRYETDDFELTKHFDGRIILKYDDHECLINTYVQ